MMNITDTTPSPQEPLRRGARFPGLPAHPALAFLQGRPQWVAWTYRDNKPNKPRKVPIDGQTGHAARVNDRSTWCAYQVAADRAVADGLAGVGFVLNHEDGIVAIDLDDCRDPTTGGLDSWAAEIVGLGETYVEVSPSGCGLRMLALAEPGTKSQVAHDVSVEIYVGPGRYITITGAHIPTTPSTIAAAPRAITALRARIATTTSKPSEASPHHGLRRDTLFGRVNTAALANLDAWVPTLLPAARKTASGYRVTSADLGRPLEEDLSLTLQGIKDFGVHDMGDPRGGKRTPIDLVLEYASDAELDVHGKNDAVDWLCEQLDLDSAELRRHAAESAFEGVTIDPPPRSPKPARLITDSRGNPTNVLANAMAMLRTRPSLDVFAFDEMARQPVILRALPAVPLAGTDPNDSYPRPARDADVSQLQELLQHDGLPKLTRDLAHQAVEFRATERGFHPVRDRLDALRWDGVPRLANWLTSYLGADTSAYHAGIGTMFLVAMVARLWKPGCQMDYVMVLEGPQGAGKSSVCELLAGKWFSNSLPQLSDQTKVAQHLRGKWLVEIAELAAFRGVGMEHLKSFVTRRVERFRPPYGKLEVVEPRQCVLVGTTNRQLYLRDETGGRRFWPVKVGRIERNALKRDLDQLFAEAIVAFRRGSPWWPDATFETEHIRSKQEERYEADVWEEIITPWVNDKTRVQVSEVARSALSFTSDRVRVADQRRIGSILHRLGWHSIKDNQGRAYVRGHDA